MNDHRTILTDLTGQSVGCLLTATAVMYFIILYNKTHRFSYARSVYVLLIGALSFAPAVYFAASVAIDSNILISWRGIVAVSLMCGGVCAIASLGLGCSRNGGALSRLASKVLKCEERHKI